MHLSASILATAVALAPGDHSALKQRIEERRLAFAAAYVASDSAGRAAIVDSARHYLFERIALDILPAWYGTPWDFNGTTRTPGTGTIACGYFKSTQGLRLRDPVRFSQRAPRPAQGLQFKPAQCHPSARPFRPPRLPVLSQQANGA